MGKIKKRDLAKRLERIEGYIRERDDRHSHHHENGRGVGRRGGGGRGHGRHGGSHGDAFEEKRVIDTAVRLVVERVARVIQRENEIMLRRAAEVGGDRRERGRDGERRERDGDSREHRDRRQDGGDRRDRDGGGEKRIVDLIVGLVSEHVEEIVTQELDRRWGPAGGEGESPEVLPPEDSESPEKDS